MNDTDIQPTRTTLATMLRRRRLDGTAKLSPHSRRTTLKWWLAAICVIAVLSVGIAIVANYFRERTRLTTICDKERDQGTFYIYTDTGTFVMKDVYIGDVRFDTADAFGRLAEGVTYEITFRGIRLGLLDMFPNILKAKPAPAGHGHENGCGT